MIQRRLYRLSFLPSSLRRCLLFLRYGTMRSIPRFASRSSRTPSGRPSPSTSTIHFVPLPRLVLPTAEPLFSLERSCRPGTSLPTSADLRHRAHPVASPGVEPHILLFPLLQPPPAGRRRRVLVGQEPPRRARLQHPQNALQTGPARRPRPASLVPAPLRLRQPRLDQLPLRIPRQLHPHLRRTRSSSIHPSSAQ